MSWRLSPLPRGWRRIRLRVLVRDRWRCQLRGPKCADRATEVDHIDDRDDHHERNLRAVCATCHASRTGRQAQAAGVAQYRPREPHPGILPEAQVGQTWGVTPLAPNPLDSRRAFASVYGSGDRG